MWVFLCVFVCFFLNHIKIPEVMSQEKKKIELGSWFLETLDRGQEDPLLWSLVEWQWKMPQSKNGHLMTIKGERGQGSIGPYRSTPYRSDIRTSH